jgi:hypothetical protein
VSDIERAVKEVRLPMIYDSVWEQSIPFQAASYNKSGTITLQNESKFKELIKKADDKLKDSTHYEFLKNMDRVVVLYFIVALGDFSWDKKIIRVDEFVNVNKIPLKNLLMVRRFCEMLKEDGYLENVDGQLFYKVSKKPWPTIKEAFLELELKANCAEFDRNTHCLVTSCMKRCSYKY